MLPLRARLDREAMAMKEYTEFPKAPELLEPVGVFYSPSRKGKRCFELEKIFIRVPSQQGPILAPVYQWYTNTELSPVGKA